MGIPMKFFAPVFLALIIITGLYFIPISSDKVDVIFTVKVVNDIWNNPKISYVDVYTQPATILPSTFSMGSLISTSDLDLIANVGSYSATKGIGKLYVTSDKTVTFKVPSVPKNEATFYTMVLRESRREIDRTEGSL